MCTCRYTGRIRCVISSGRSAGGVFVNIEYFCAGAGSGGSAHTPKICIGGSQICAAGEVTVVCDQTEGIVFVIIQSPCRGVCGVTSEVIAAAVVEITVCGIAEDPGTVGAGDIKVVQLVACNRISAEA